MAGIIIRISVLLEGLTVLPHYRGGPAAVQPTAGFLINQLPVFAESPHIDSPTFLNRKLRQLRHTLNPAQTSNQKSGTKATVRFSVSQQTIGQQSSCPASPPRQLQTASTLARAWRWGDSDVYLKNEREFRTRDRSSALVAIKRT